MPGRKRISLVCGIYAVALLLPALAEAAVPDPDVLWWKFDEGTGTVVRDSSGKGHDGVITGVTWKSGGVGGLGYCLDFPGQIQQSLAAGILTETEAAMLRDYDRRVMELIHVDDFTTEEMAAGAQPADADVRQQRVGNA